MTVKEFINVMNYSEFEIAEMKDDVIGIKTIFMINEETPLKFISDKLLNAKVILVEVNDNYDRDRKYEPLFIIKIEKIEEDE